MSESPDSSEKASPVAKIFLVALPLGLIISIVIALWWGAERQLKVARQDSEFFERTVAENDVSDTLHKLFDLIGERNGSSESTAQALTATAATIDGLLGPSNTGYDIQRVAGPADWPIIIARIPEPKKNAPPIWVVTSYDTRPGSPGSEANTTGLAATLATARALVNQARIDDIRFAFIPHLNDPEAPILETSTTFQNQLTTPPRAIFCIEAMGNDSPLWVTSRDTTLPALQLASGIGEIHGAETICLGEDSDLSSILFDIGLPAIRVATRPIVLTTEPDDTPPSAARVATAASRLVTLIKRAAK